MDSNAAVPDPAPTAAQANQPQPKTDLGALKRMFDDSRTLTQEARLQSLIDRDYYDGHQLNDTELGVLRGRKEPCIIINRVRAGVNGILGVVEQGKTDPRAYMRNPPDPTGGGTQPAQTAAAVPGQQPQAVQPDLDAADVASMTLRFIADTNHFQPIKMDVLENGLIEGTGAVIIECIDQDVMVTQIRWEEHFADPRARRADFKDARYEGVAKWMYADQVVAIYPDKKADILAFSSGGATQGLFAYDQSWEDRPENLTPWVDSKQRRMIIVEMYYLEDGKWWRSVFYAGGTLEQAISPYQDDKGQPVNPIEAWSAFIDRHNRRYGIVRDMRGPQDEINMRRRKLLHLVNVRQVQPIDENSPPVNVDTVRAEAARPDGVIPPGWKIVDTSSMAQGQAELLAEAKSEIERMGPNPAILGRQGADASGRAVQARQQAGMTEFARVLGRFTDWELRCYKQMYGRARQFWKDPKWIRVTNDEGAPQYVRINEPNGADVVPHPTIPGMQMLQPKTKNNIAKMDVDIIVDAVPDTATLQQEIFQELVQLAQAYGPQAVPFQILVQMSPLPRKRELIDALEKAQAQAAQAAQPVTQAKMDEQQAETALKVSQGKLNEANAGLVEVETVTAAMEGHMKATAQAQLPPGVMLDGSGTPISVVPPPQPQPGETVKPIGS